MVRSIGIIPLIALAACGVGGGPPSATAAAPVAAEVERDLARSRLTIIQAASQSGGKVVVALGTAGECGPTSITRAVASSRSFPASLFARPS